MKACGVSAVRWMAVLIVASLCLPLSGSQPTAPSLREPRTVETSGLHLVTPATQRAIDKALAYLAARQNDDGSLGSGMYPRNVGVTALSGMAFLAAGHTPGRGRYGKHVAKALDFVISRCRDTGFIVDDESKSHGPMYGHGFATLFLAEAYGMTRRKDLREKLDRAVKLIIDTQNAEGGWRYYPEPKEADISVTVCQIMALRAARNAGISIPNATIDRCIAYVKRCQNSDGGFRYQLLRRQQSVFPRSAAGVVTLYSAGVYKGREVERGLKYLMRYLPQGEMLRFQSHYFYGHYYAVQAMWHAGGNYWDRWYPAIRNELVRRQQPNGGWSHRSICSEYGTAMACLVLQMPNHYLPIFQR